MTSNSISKEEILISLNNLSSYVERQKYIGFDPYDGLNSKIFDSLRNKWIKYFIMQSNKELPINLRNFFGIKKGLDIKGLGLFANSYFILSKLKDIENRSKFFKQKGNKILQYLLKKSLIKKYGNHCWSGHYFKTQGTTGSHNPTKPEIISTSVCGNAFFKHFQITSDIKSLEILNSIEKFYLKYLFKENNNKPYFNYYPMKIKNNRIVYNASAVGISLLSKITTELSTKILITQMMDLLISSQKPTGEWYYSIDQKTGIERKQIDFHQGFMLDSLYDFIKYTKPENEKYLKALIKGAEFYKNEQFLPDGRCKWRLPRVWPIDIHNQAQGIITFCKLSEFNPEYLDFSKTITKWTIENLQDESGYFYYQKWPFFTNKIQYMRWGQAWMMLALATLLEVIKNEK